MARVDYDRMAADYVAGRALPPDGLEPWRLAIGQWLPDGGGPVLDVGADTGLRLLPDQEFAAGLAALDRAAAAETTPTPVTDRLDLLVLR